MSSNLQADRARAAELDIQIRFLERALSVLRPRRAQIQERLDSYKYPVLTLPNEIVSEIFVHFLPTYPKCPPLTGILSPTNLTQICRKWREIALGTPWLWRAIHLPLDTDGPSAEHLRDFGVWFLRSGCCPLSIEFTDEPGVDRQDFRLPSSHAARCEVLTIFLQQWPIPILDNPMPLLRHIDVAVQSGHFPSGEEPVVLGDVPLLRSARLDDVGSQAVSLPWAQLTSLHLHILYPEECVEVLQWTPNLVHCVLDLVDNGPEPPLPDVMLLRLESLVLLVGCGGGCGSLDFLVTPALRSLQVSEDCFPGPTLIALASFVSKSGCTLQNLHIAGKRQVSDDAYTRSFPSVKISFAKEYIGNDPAASNNER
ncbi:hypothetical protein C8R46DRAFT_1353799 [Mycena filopes]|nr:hypothetical protein C8R46DRAFT_1353799 [Mycena filopes]